MQASSHTCAGFIEMNHGLCFSEMRFDLLVDGCHLESNFFAGCHDTGIS